MKVLTFSGHTPAEALRKVKEKLGDEVVIIETKQVRKKTINQKGLYEIVVGITDEEVGKVAQKTTQPMRDMSQREAFDRSEDVLLSISSAAKQFSKIQNIPTDPYSTKGYETQESFSHEQSQARIAKEEFAEVRTQIDKLTDKVKLIQNMFWKEKNPAHHGIPIPPEFAEIYRLALESGMAQEHLEHIMRLTLEHMPMKMRQNSTTVKRYFQVLLRKMVPVRLEMPLKPPHKKVMMLVGPTGVGKTTSVAKLAARYSYLLDKKYKVGLVVLDTYRIGAVEQLMQYARMMKLGIETVVDPPEFTQALNALSYCDYILIDTMGSSPHDQEKINKLYSCLETNQTPFDVETTLVLPTHLKYDDMINMYEKFSYLGVDTVMFTKLDETQKFGNIFSFLNEIDVPVSYLSIGQEVPEDLVVASSDYLVECMLDGFTKGMS